MNGFCADNSHMVILADDDLFADEVTRVNSADTLELKKSVAVVVHDHEADFVRMRVKKNAQRFFIRAERSRSACPSTASHKFKCARLRSGRMKRKNDN